MTKLTEMQTTVLLAFPGGADAEGDNGASWTDVADLATETGLTKKQVQAVLGSLSTKGLIYADEEGGNGNIIQCLTDDGARLVGKIMEERHGEPKTENGLEMDPEAGEAFEAPLTDLAGAPIHQEPAEEDKAAYDEQLDEEQQALDDAFANLDQEKAEELREEAPAEEAPAELTWETCKTAEDVFAVAKTFGLTLEAQDTAAIVAGFPGVHKNLKSLGTFHWKRFPKATPRTGTFVALTKKNGAVIIEGGEVLGPLADKATAIVALWKC